MIQLCLPVSDHILRAYCNEQQISRNICISLLKISLLATAPILEAEWVTHFSAIAISMIIT